MPGRRTPPSVSESDQCAAISVPCLRGLAPRVFRQIASARRAVPCPISCLDRESSLHCIEVQLRHRRNSVEKHRRPEQVFFGAAFLQLLRMRKLARSSAIEIGARHPKLKKDWRSQEESYPAQQERWTPRIFGGVGIFVIVCSR